MPDAPKTLVLLEYCKTRDEETVKQQRAAAVAVPERPVKLSVARTQSWAGNPDPDAESPTTNSLREFIGRNYDSDGQVKKEKPFKYAASYAELSRIKHPHHEQVEALRKQVEEDREKALKRAAEEKKRDKK